MGVINSSLLFSNMYRNGKITSGKEPSQAQPLLHIGKGPHQILLKLAIYPCVATEIILSTTNSCTIGKEGSHGYLVRSFHSSGYLHLAR
jgi:hypothetical protein